MNTITDALRDAMLEREAEQGARMTWGGMTFHCAGGAQFTQQMLGPGGFALDNDVTIAVRRELFPDAIPAKGQRVSYYATESADAAGLKIDNVTDVLGVILILACNHINKGA